MTDQFQADVIRLLEQISADVRDIKAGKQNVNALTFSSDAALAGLLQAIHQAIGDRVFSAGDLLIHAALPIAVSLHAAIVAELGIANARKIGKAMARAEGHNLGGYVVVRVSSDSTGTLWSVRRV